MLNSKYSSVYKDLDMDFTHTSFSTQFAWSEHQRSISLVGKRRTLRVLSERSMARVDFTPCEAELLLTDAKRYTFIRLTFCDLLGRSLSKVVPSKTFRDSLRGGVPLSAGEVYIQTSCRSSFCIGIFSPILTLLETKGLFLNALCNFG